LPLKLTSTFSIASLCAWVRSKDEREGQAIRHCRSGAGRWNVAALGAESQEDIAQSIMAEIVATRRQQEKLT